MTKLSVSPSGEGQDNCTVFSQRFEGKATKLVRLSPIGRYKSSTVNKNWRIILRFAIAGFVVTWITAVCVVFRAANIVVNLLLLITPFWIFGTVFGPLPFDHRAALWFMVLQVAVANALAYTVVGAVIVGLRSMLKRKRGVESR